MSSLGSLSLGELTFDFQRCIASPLQLSGGHLAFEGETVGADAHHPASFMDRLGGPRGYPLQAPLKLRFDLGEVGPFCGWIQKSHPRVRWSDGWPLAVSHSGLRIGIPNFHLPVLKKSSLAGLARLVYFAFPKPKSSPKGLTPRVPGLYTCLEGHFSGKQKASTGFGQSAQELSVPWFQSDSYSCDVIAIFQKA